MCYLFAEKGTARSASKWIKKNFSPCYEKDNYINWFSYENGMFLYFSKSPQVSLVSKDFRPERKGKCHIHLQGSMYKRVGGKAATVQPNLIRDSP